MLAVISSCVVLTLGFTDPFLSQRQSPAYQNLLKRYEQDPRLEYGLKNGIKPMPSRDVGFYIHVFHQPAAVIHQVQRVAQVFPGSPIYVMSDGGYDFSELCKLYNCTFKLCPPANDRWNPWPFLRRMWDATMALKTDYVVMLEPDNTIHRSIYVWPDRDAGGLEDNNPQFHRETVAYIEALGKKHRPDFKWKYTGSGLAGGAYFRSAAILDAFSDAAVAEFNFTEIEILESKRVYSSDFMMPVALAARGYTYEPWRDITQFDLRGDIEHAVTDQPIEAAFQHYGRGFPGGKPTYNLKDTADTAKLFSPGRWEKAEQVVCQRCYKFQDYENTYGTQECTNRLAKGSVEVPTQDQYKIVKDAFVESMGGWNKWKGQDYEIRIRSERDKQERHERADKVKLKMYGPEHAKDKDFAGWD